MSIISSEQYRAAFSDYLRKGTPIRLSRKDTVATGQYVWRTRRETKVRQTHRVNDGRIFDWADAPATGHPGADSNCRCEAITSSAIRAWRNPLPDHRRMVGNLRCRNILRAKRKRLPGQGKSVMRKFLFAVLGAAAALAVTIWINHLPPETVLPNGFVIRGNDVVLWPGGKEIANDDVDFICFDDRYLWILTIRGGSLLLDAQTLRRVDQGDGSRRIDPSGLRTSGVACNGYYTSMNGPGLLHDGARFPFLPDCGYVNHTNLALKDKAWLNRPCAAM